MLPLGAAQQSAGVQRSACCLRRRFTPGGCILCWTVGSRRGCSRQQAQLQQAHQHSPVTLTRVCVCCLLVCRVPYLRAPFFAWVGRPWLDARACVHHEQKVERPALFPPTFLYTQSWEDPEPDMKVSRLLLPLQELSCTQLRCCMENRSTPSAHCQHTRGQGAARAAQRM